ncbi:MAG: hypothetical protein MUE73_12765 [Planctomycetes bacterium]|jgi:hypothetical protein|nr:hypothetical protein [Planctomycetota bacterium]
MRFAICCAAVALAAMPTMAEKPAAPDLSEAVAFRVEVGVTAPKVVEVRLVQSGPEGSGIDGAWLDTDGDGTFETHQPFPESTDPRTKRPVREAKIPIRHEDADWVLDLYGLRFSRQAPSDLGPQTYAHWSVTKGGFYAWFINVPLTFDGTAEGAKPGRAFRMAPPLEWKIGASTRGPSSLVNVGLKDGNGGTLRLVRKDGVEVRPEVALFGGEKEVFAATATYG